MAAVVESCGTCQHYVGDAKKGECFRGPPTPVFVGPRNSQLEMISARAPIEVTTRACGEYKKN